MHRSYYWVTCVINGGTNQIISRIIGNLMMNSPWFTQTNGNDHGWDFSTWNVGIKLSPNPQRTDELKSKLMQIGGSSGNL